MSRTAQRQSVANASGPDGLAATDGAFGAMLDHAAVGIALVDLGTGRLRRANARYRAILGVAEQDAAEFDISRLACDAAHDASWRGFRAGTEGDDWVLEKCWPRDDGTVVWLRVSVVRIDGHEAKTAEAVVTLEDITLRKHAESAARASGELSEEVLSVLSHDLRNPLSVISMQAEILQRSEEAQSPRIKRAAGVIVAKVQVVAAILSDIIDHSPLRTGSFRLDLQLVCLDEIIGNAAQPFREEAARKQVAMHVYVEHAPLHARADGARVAQIATHLLRDALDTTPEGGTIELRLAREGAMARLDVQDTGAGVPPEQMARLFDWFGRGRALRSDATGGRRSGRGGLALIRRIAELHGGSMEAASEGSGKGARFTVWLPVSRAPNREPSRVS